MMRLHFTVEGQTEQAFVSQLLVPHLAGRLVLVGKPRLTALCKKKGRVHRGGVRKYEPLKNDIGRWLKEDQAPSVRFTTMIDLYALPKDFPGYAQAAALADPYDRVGSLEKSLAEDIGDRRFIPYIQLHEFESLLLTAPEKFGSYYPRHDKAIDGLQAECSAVDSPEKIDDGQETAPSKRIGKHIPEYPRAKPTAGPIVAAEIGLDKMRAACPHFAQWLETLENLDAVRRG